MSWYRVDVACKCGRTHLITGALQIPNGPNHAGTLAELYPRHKLPKPLAEMLNDLVWCGETGGYVVIQEAGEVTLALAARWPSTS
jgi:hypothetical protein